MFERWFARRPPDNSSEEAYRRIVAQARRPEFYAGGGVPDSLDGRFEMLALHLFLVLHRLQREGADPACAALAQALSLDPGAGAEAAGVADSIRREAVRAARIVTELLTFARQRPLRRAPTDLNQVVQAAMASTPRASEDGATWEMELDPSLPELIGDGEQLQQVMANLLLNGAQAMAARGGGRGTIRTWATDRVVGCEVCDTGTGIAADVLPRIFEPFFTTKDVGAGTGLGLSISHGIIRAHGGDIQVKNLAAGGAAFWFELPRAGAPGMKVTNG